MMSAQERQMSESYRIAVCLAISGGFMDAYTYFLRGGVFANAETGNIILFGLNMFEGNYVRAVQYFIPICAFSAGIFAAAMLRRRFLIKQLHWRQTVLIVEMIFLFFVGLIPLGKWNIVANSIVAFVSALQFEAFKKMRGDNFASVFCTGNLRSAMEQVYLWGETRDKVYIYRFIRYAGIIIMFTTGVILCAALAPYFKTETIWISMVFLMISCIIMHWRKNASQNGNCSNE
ncbi:MAG: YoaK family protein [Lachnospiraceae bacterium]